MVTLSELRAWHAKQADYNRVGAEGQEWQAAHGLSERDRRVGARNVVGRRAAQAFHEAAAKLLEGL